MQIRMQNELFVWSPTLPHPVKPDPGTQTKTDYDNNNWCKIQMNQFLPPVWSYGSIKHVHVHSFNATHLFILIFGLIKIEYFFSLLKL